mmetsp:Transcript_19321/g.41576  ORF Transcript_19321/g.41576 Transcript_19321/m.41576 type:complete len:251 (-) Transcript_19321:704-1456(-)
MIERQFGNGPHHAAGRRAIFLDLLLLGLEFGPFDLGRIRFAAGRTFAALGLFGSGRSRSTVVVVAHSLSRGRCISSRDGRCGLGLTGGHVGEGGSTTALSSGTSSFRTIVVVAAADRVVVVVAAVPRRHHLATIKTSTARHGRHEIRRIERGRGSGGKIGHGSAASQFGSSIIAAVTVVVVVGRSIILVIVDPFQERRMMMFVMIGFWLTATTGQHIAAGFDFARTKGMIVMLGLLLLLLQWWLEGGGRG